MFPLPGGARDLQRRYYVGVGHSRRGNMRIHEHGAPALCAVGGAYIGVEPAASNEPFLLGNCGRVAQLRGPKDGTTGRVYQRRGAPN